MKRICSITILGLLAVFAAFAQYNVLTQTTLGANVAQGDKTITVAAAGTITAGSFAAQTVGSQLYVVDFGQTIGEVMNVTAISGTTVTVRRTPSANVAHASGAMVLYGSPKLFYSYDPTGACTLATTLVTPWVNVKTGNQWLCSSISGTWVPGFGNKSAVPQDTAVVASVAGATLPSGPLFHVSGTNAITSWTVPVGAANGASFCITPDAAYTTASTLTASTAVAGQIQCWHYSRTNSDWMPSYR